MSRAAGTWPPSSGRGSPQALSMAPLIFSLGVCACVCLRAIFFCLFPCPPAALTVPALRTCVCMLHASGGCAGCTWVARVQGKIKAMETELASMRESVTELEFSIRGLEEQNGLLKRALGDAP